MNMLNQISINKFPSKNSLTIVTNGKLIFKYLFLITGPKVFQLFKSSSNEITSSIDFIRLLTIQ